MQWLASPDEPHLHGSQPTNASLTANSAVILPPVCSSGCSLSYSKRRCTRYPGVHSFSANTKPNGLRRIFPVPHRFQRVPSSFPVLLFPNSLALARSWLFRLPVSFPVPSSYGPPGPVLPSVGGAAYGGRRRRDGGWSTMRLTVAQRWLYCCLQVISISVSAYESGRVCRRAARC